MVQVSTPRGSVHASACPGDIILTLPSFCFLQTMSSPICLVLIDSCFGKTESFCCFSENLRGIRSHLLELPFLTGQSKCLWFRGTWLAQWSGDSFFFPFFFFYPLERGRERGFGEEQRERENLKLTPCPERSRTWGSISQL